MKPNLFENTDFGNLAAYAPKIKPVLEYMEHTSASQVSRMIEKDVRLIGLTKGQFSLIDLIYSTLQKIGPSDVIVATWSAGIKDANTVKWMLEDTLIKSFLLITDHSYANRQKKYVLALTDLFGKENIRTSEIHAKFVLISNENYKICIRTSMNLNANRTCETFELDENADIYNFYYKFVESTFGEVPAGFTPDSNIVNRALSRTFNDLESKSNWQNFSNE